MGREAGEDRTSTRLATESQPRCIFCAEPIGSEHLPEHCFAWIKEWRAEEDRHGLPR